MVFTKNRHFLVQLVFCPLSLLCLCPLYPSLSRSYTPSPSLSRQQTPPSRSSVHRLTCAGAFTSMDPCSASKSREFASLFNESKHRLQSCGHRLRKPSNVVSTPPVQLPEHVAGDTRIWREIWSAERRTRGSVNVCKQKYRVPRIKDLLSRDFSYTRSRFSRSTMLPVLLHFSSSNVPRSRMIAIRSVPISMGRHAFAYRPGYIRPRYFGRAGVLPAVIREPSISNAMPDGACV